MSTTDTVLITRPVILGKKTSHGSSPPPFEIALQSSSCWWNMRRLHYNVGLVIAGVLAFAVYAVVGWSFPPDEEFEFTVFTTVFQGIGYVFMMLLANICFCIGPVSERYFKPVDVAAYRQRNYALGFWFSVFLPFSIPVLLIIEALWTSKHP